MDSFYKASKTIKTEEKSADRSQWRMGGGSRIRGSPTSSSSPLYGMGMGHSYRSQLDMLADGISDNDSSSSDSARRKKKRKKKSTGKRKAGYDDKQMQPPPAKRAREGEEAATEGVKREKEEGEEEDEVSDSDSDSLSSEEE